MQNLERILNTAIENYNRDTENKIMLNQYNRQYIATTNEGGQKEVWLNCFCKEKEGKNRKVIKQEHKVSTSKENWRKKVVKVFDGGKCYFNLKVNLLTEKYYDFIVNGKA